jgi:hypothetical protein
MRRTRNNMRRAPAAGEIASSTGHFGRPQPNLPSQEGVKGVIRVVSSGEDFNKNKSKNISLKLSRGELPLITPFTPSCGAGQVIGGGRSKDRNGRPTSPELLSAVIRARRRSGLTAERKAAERAPTESPGEDCQAPPVAGAISPAWTDFCGTSPPDQCSHRTTPAIRTFSLPALSGGKTGDATLSCACVQRSPWRCSARMNNSRSKHLWVRLARDLRASGIELFASTQAFGKYRHFGSWPNTAGDRADRSSIKSKVNSGSCSGAPWGSWYNGIIIPLSPAPCTGKLLFVGCNVSEKPPPNHLCKSVVHRLFHLTHTGYFPELNQRRLQNAS